MKHTALTILALAAALALAGSAQAAVSTLTNAGFETGDFTGWSRNGGFAGVYSEDAFAAYFGFTDDGTQLAVIQDRDAGDGNGADIFQRVGTIDAGVFYTVSFLQGAQTNASAVGVHVKIYAADTSTNPLTSLTTATLVASVLSPSVFTYDSYGADNKGFFEKSVTLDPGAAYVGKDLYLVFQAQDSAVRHNAAGSATIDRVAISQTLIPEPATMSLLAVGGLAALIRRKK